MRMPVKVGFLMAACLYASVGWAAEEKRTTTPLSQVEEYNLSEQCGKQSEVFFKIKYRLTNGDEPTPDVSYRNADGIGSSQYNYRNHYNKKLNKCFIRSETVNVSGTDKSINFSILSLDDVNEHKQYGEYIGDYMDLGKKPLNPPMCYVSGYKCKSYEEWDALIKPYMEE